MGCDGEGYCKQESDLLPCVDMFCECKHRNSASAMYVGEPETSPKPESIPAPDEGKEEA